MKILGLAAAIALLSSACQPAHSPHSPVAPKAPSDPPATVVAPPERPALALENCETTPSGTVSVNFADAYTPEAVATWLAGWSCREVILPGHRSDRVARGALVEAVAATELPDVLDKLLTNLDMIAISEKDITVFVDRGSRDEVGADARVRWSPPKGSRVVVQVEPAERKEVGELIRGGIKNNGSGSYTISRAARDAMLASPRVFGRGARLVPSIKDGQTNGFKLYAIRPSSVFAQLGFANGDTLLTINGNSLTSPDKALEAYTKVRSAETFTVEIVRRSKPVTHVYTIVD